MAIWQDLVEEGFTARYASVRRFVRQLRGRTPVEARVVITTAPGEEAQVDYGDGPMVRHPQTAVTSSNQSGPLRLRRKRDFQPFAMGCLLPWQESVSYFTTLRGPH